MLTMHIYSLSRSVLHSHHAFRTMGNRPRHSSLLRTPIRDMAPTLEQSPGTQLPTHANSSVSTADTHTTYLHHMAASPLAVPQSTTGSILPARNFGGISYWIRLSHRQHTESSKEEPSGGKTASTGRGRISIQGTEPQPDSRPLFQVQPGLNSDQQIRCHTKMTSTKQLETDHKFITSQDQ